MENQVKEKTSEPNMIVFARQTYTPLQKDIFTLAVSQLETGFNVQPDLFANKTVVITAKMLSEVAPKDYQRLKHECLDMQTKPFVVSNDAQEEFDSIIPFPRIKYKKGRIELTMFSDVAQSFLELKRGYSEIYIRESLSLEQFNKKRLYEMLCSYRKRFSPIWTVSDEQLKYYLGYENNEYKGRPKEFGTKIVGVCVNAINEKTSLNVKYTRGKDREGWYTVFTVSEKKKIEATAGKEISIQALDEKGQRLVKKLEELNVRQDHIRTIIEKHQPECWKWLSVNRANLDTKKFKNPAGVMLVHLGLVEPKV
jgi:plasmid replication initiation protein